MGKNKKAESSQAKGSGEGGAFVWRRWAREIGALVYPRRCWVCQQETDGGASCDAHRLRLGFEQARCRRCLAALGNGLRDALLCWQCRRTSPSFGRLIALGSYREGEALGDWILALKHGGRPDLAQPLGMLLAQSIPADLGGGLQGAFVVPVPLHPLRRLERGYDQAFLLARSVARHAQLELARPLERRRWTPPQGSSLGASRTANVEGAFGLRRRRGSQIQGRVLLLVDDVFTSGATLSACSRVLRAAGAAEVHGLVLARAGDKNTSI